MMARARLVVGLASLLAIVVAETAACGPLRGAAPACHDVRRLALVAQSVPGASYLPCISTLRPGWSTSGFEARDGDARFSLVSDRDPDHPVRVEVRPECPEAGTPATPRAPGARTALALTSIAPRYRGTLSDVYPGGCTTYRFDFARGPHIGLVDDMENIVALLPRQDLRLAARSDYGVDVGP